VSVPHLLNQLGSVALLSLLIAVIPAVMAAGYAIWPTESKLALMRPLSLASLFGALAGFTSEAISALFLTAEHPGGSPMALFAVALVPLFVSFGSLTVAWLLVALGLRRTA
jgi:hypothetical protein